MTKRKPKPGCPVCFQPIKGKKDTITAKLHPDFAGPKHAYCTTMLILSRGIRFKPHGQNAAVSTHIEGHMGNADAYPLFPPISVQDASHMHGARA